MPESNIQNILDSIRILETITEQQLLELQTTVAKIIAVEFLDRKVTPQYQAIQDLAEDIIHSLFVNKRLRTALILCERIKSRVSDYIRNEKRHTRAKMRIIREFNDRANSPETRFSKTEAIEICVAYFWVTESKKYNSTNEVIEAVESMYSPALEPNNKEEGLAMGQILTMYPNLKKDWIYQKSKSKKIRSEKINGRYLFNRTDLERELAMLQASPSAA